MFWSIGVPVEQLWTQEHRPGPHQAVLGLPSTLIRQEDGASRKRFSNRRNLKSPALRSSVDGKHSVNEAFQKRWRRDNHVISLPEISSNTNPIWPVIVAGFKFQAGNYWPHWSGTKQQRNIFPFELSLYDSFLPLLFKTWAIHHSQSRHVHTRGSHTTTGITTRRRFDFAEYTLFRNGAILVFCFLAS